jgi:deoxyribonuclease V
MSADAAVLPPLPDLPGELEALWAQVPRGRVTTYGDLAEALGNRGAARWVGHYALRHEHGEDCPCHRIVRRDGALGLFAGGDAMLKQHALQEEGVTFCGPRVALDEHRFAAFRGNRPLEQLRQVQEAMVRRAARRRRTRIPEALGGVDVSYAADDWGVAAYALVARGAREPIWSTTVARRAPFPYITSYLSFRELPLLLELLEAVRSADMLAEVLLVDGSGMLHPRGAGLATHLGVAAGIPTVGVTKKLLCGQVDRHGLAPGGSTPVMHNGRAAGTAIRPTTGTAKPLFVSPGQRVDLPYAEQLVRLWLGNRRLPEPLYWADRLSRAAVRDRRH